MRFSFWPGPNNSWQDVLALSQHAEQTGWDGIYFADHFMPNAADTSGPNLECFTVLAALAVAVPRVRLGSLVAGNTYRNPAVLAKMAANIDIISGGRLILGLGAGWQENEHTAYDIPFYTLGGRMKRLEEACQVVTGLFANGQTTLEGKYYALKDAPLAPKPVQAKLPLLIGGGGEKVTMRIAATYADEWNTWGVPSHLKQKMGVLDQHCRDLGRDPKSLKRSAQAMVVLTDDPERLERMRGAGGFAVIGGRAEQTRAAIQEYIDAGLDEFIVPDFNLGRTAEQKLAQMDALTNQVFSAFK